MKNQDILSVVNAGTLAITANDLDAAQAYKVIKFKRAIKKAFDAFAEAEKDLIKSVGIEDAAAFDAKRAELVKNSPDCDELKEMDEKVKRLAELRKSLYAEEVKLDGVITMPFASFHKLQQENKNLEYKPLNVFEDLLEGVLWTADEE